MMDEMNVLNAPKKVVDGLTEVFEGLAQMFEGVSDQLELLGADATPEDKRIFPAVNQEAPAVSEKKGSAAPHPRRMLAQTHSRTPRTVPGKQRKKKTSRRMMPMPFRGARIPVR